MSQIALALQSKRKQLHIAAQQLASKLDVSRQTIYKWERGEATPSHGHLLKLATLLDLDLGVLATQEPENSYQPSFSVETLKNELEQCQDLRSARIAMSHFTQNIGMSHFFYKQIFRGDLSSQRRAIVLTDVPKVWSYRYQEMDYVQIDPTWRYSLSNVAPILGYDLFDQALKLNDPALNAYYRDFHSHASPHYIVIPVHGACCMATFVIQIYTDRRDAREYISERIGCSTLASHYLFQRLHKMASSDPIHPEMPLTNKEIDTIRLLASGMAIKDIARTLSISIATVNARLNSSKIKLSAKNREEMVLIASALNLLSHDIKKIMLRV